MPIQINILNPKYTKENGEDNQEMYMLEIIMTREIIKIDIDKTARKKDNIQR